VGSQRGNRETFRSECGRSEHGRGLQGNAMRNGRHGGTAEGSKNMNETSESTLVLAGSTRRRARFWKWYGLPGPAFPIVPDMVRTKVLHNLRVRISLT